MKPVDQLAREAGATKLTPLLEKSAEYVMGAEELERFAALMRADERERCAKRCELMAERWRNAVAQHYAAHECAASIRSGG